VPLPRGQMQSSDAIVSGRLSHTGSHGIRQLLRQLF
jgi:hypothetical protein